MQLERKILIDMRKKILITGANGFIGSFLVEQALEMGFDVWAGIRPTSNTEFLSGKNVKHFYLNYADKVSVKESFAVHASLYGKFDYIIHNAGLTKTLNRLEFELVNFQYTKNLVDALIESDIVPDKFVFMSSLAAYGPGDEKSMEAIKLSDIPKPVSLYGMSKLKAELYIKSIPDFPYLIFRPTGVYGPREKDYFVVYKSINRGLETYIGSDEQYLSFVYVTDLARLVVGSLESRHLQKEYFVSDLKKYTSHHFNQLLKQELEKKTVRIVFPRFFVRLVASVNGAVSSLFGLVPTLNSEKYKEISCNNWHCDCSELVRDFGYEPEYNLQKGVAETIRWYKERDLL